MNENHLLEHAVPGAEGEEGNFLTGGIVDVAIFVGSGPGVTEASLGVASWVPAPLSHELLDLGLPLGELLGVQLAVAVSIEKSHCRIARVVAIGSNRLSRRRRQRSSSCLRRS